VDIDLGFTPATNTNAIRRLDLRLGENIETPVLRQHLRDIEVGADAECHRDCEIAVARRLTAHVEHVLDAIDLVLERRCNRAGDRLGRCAGIGRGDLDCRWNDFRVLGDGKDRVCAQANAITAMLSTVVKRGRSMKK
jgi:hypothetical protein